jgi:hypothetical protein
MLVQLSMSISLARIVNNIINKYHQVAHFRGVFCAVGNVRVADAQAS